MHVQFFRKICFERKMFRQILSLKNTEILYKNKSTFELLRAWIILSVCKRKWIVSPSVSMLRSTESTTIASMLLRRTIWPHFCAGESIKDCQDVGRNMKQCLQNASFIDITHVVIENQLSPIANRMKTIQGMLAQYFIMIDENIDIQFISSSNKLKQFESTQNKSKTKNEKNEIITPNYKENKKDSVYFCNKIIENNIKLQKWKETLLVSKKDDLADCFLQGLWYFKLHNIISYAEDLKINIV